MSFRVFERLAAVENMFTAEDMDTPDAYYEVFAEVFSLMPCVPWSAPLYTTVDMDSADFRVFETAAVRSLSNTISTSSATVGTKS